MGKKTPKRKRKAMPKQQKSRRSIKRKPGLTGEEFQSPRERVPLIVSSPTIIDAEEESKFIPPKAPKAFAFANPLLYLKKAGERENEMQKNVADKIKKYVSESEKTLGGTIKNEEKVFSTKIKNESEMLQRSKNSFFKSLNNNRRELAKEERKFTQKAREDLLRIEEEINELIKSLLETIDSIERKILNDIQKGKMQIEGSEKKLFQRLSNARAKISGEKNNLLNSIEENKKRIELFEKETAIKAAKNGKTAQKAQERRIKEAKKAVTELEHKIVRSIESMEKYFLDIERTALEEINYAKRKLLQAEKEAEEGIQASREKINESKRELASKLPKGPSKKEIREKQKQLLADIKLNKQKVNSTVNGVNESIISIEKKFTNAEKEFAKSINAIGKETILTEKKMLRSLPKLPSKQRIQSIEREFFAGIKSDGKVIMDNEKALIGDEKEAVRRIEESVYHGIQSGKKQIFKAEESVFNKMPTLPSGQELMRKEHHLLAQLAEKEKELIKSEEDFLHKGKLGLTSTEKAILRGVETEKEKVIRAKEEVIKKIEKGEKNFVRAKEKVVTNGKTFFSHANKNIQKSAREISSQVNSKPVLNFSTPKMPDFKMFAPQTTNRKMKEIYKAKSEEKHKEDRQRQSKKITNPLFEVLRAILSLLDRFKEKVNDEPLMIPEKSSITTVFDSVYEELKQKKIVKVNYLAKKYNLNNQQIIDIAIIFEETGKIEIFYPLIGSPRLLLKEKGELSDENY